jgi:tRNA-Thr(GGU) m(6)t(6)A37 methyltransferase TsaA
VEQFTMTAIGHVRGGRVEATDDEWGAVEATIELDAGRFTAQVVAGLDDFSHVEVVYVFDQVDETRVNLGARHPRGNEAWPLVGIFAQRAKARPNRIGVTTCELLGVDGLAVRLRGLDAIDGTPVLDLKPYLAEFAPRTPTRQPAWATALMAEYWAR